ncbi:hypothetical protein HMPREF1705_04699 [Acetomicrobium hydrogeniformans ATCC BAA-1850]|uniref:Uncharacterized protein n=1 Tax=Acetomicrobium hydrogeniformans ATCC BAA-1850 TaxID=592015 RepID=A0A0T5XCK6_9BACT|nr:hypothetical protein HMPREF1705_04699 [Acetomicrobium hydrogeniformans ATCC BAA-1850]
MEISFGREDVLCLCGRYNLKFANFAIASVKTRKNFKGGGCQNEDAYFC